MVILHFAPFPELCLAAVAPGKSSFGCCGGVSPRVSAVPVQAWIYGEGKKGWEEDSGCVWAV